jgi:hypothetical protein
MFSAEPTNMSEVLNELNFNRKPVGISLRHNTTSTLIKVRFKEQFVLAVVALL